MRKLIIKGKEITALTIAAGDSAPEKYAAGELCKYLERVAGIGQGGAFEIIIKIADSLAKEEYRISIGENGEEVFILGGSGRGVIYGVYAFLEKYMGFRAFLPGLETLGEGDIIVDEGFSHIPVIYSRQSDWQCGRDTDWRVKNGINDRSTPEEMGGCTRMDDVGVHTMANLTGADQWKEQPCLTDPEVLKRAIAKVREILAAEPDRQFISVSQNDNRNFCQCERCAAVDEEEGSHMGTLLRFVNAVADDIKDDYPHVTVDTLAYQYSRQAPRITKPRPNVCIRLCSIECCFSHPLNDPTCPENVHFHNDILEWNNICDNIYIWDYVTNFLYYIAPFPNFGVLRENMRFFAEHGVKGMYPEGNFNSPASGEFGELRCYLLAKLMMDPHMSTTDYYRHMDEFLAAYYGEGWRYIRAFIDFTTMEAKNNHAKIYDHPFKIISRDRYEAMEEIIDGWWDKAEALAGDRLESVQRSRMQWDYIKLLLHPDETLGQAFIDKIKKHKVRWCENKDFPNDVDFRKTPDQWQNWQKQQ